MTPRQAEVACLYDARRACPAALPLPAPPPCCCCPAPPLNPCAPAPPAPQLAYLAVSLLLEPASELAIMVVATIQADLRSDNFLTGARPREGKAPGKEGRRMCTHIVAGRAVQCAWTCA